VDEYSSISNKNIYYHGKYTQVKETIRSASVHGCVCVCVCVCKRERERKQAEKKRVRS
jgi:hypothetical protein